MQTSAVRIQKEELFFLSSILVFLMRAKSSTLPTYIRPPQTAQSEALLLLSNSTVPIHGGLVYKDKVFFSCRFKQKPSSSLHAMHKSMLLLLGAAQHLRPDPSTLEPEDGMQTPVCKCQSCLLGGFQQTHLPLSKSQLLWMEGCSINVQLTEIHRLVSQMAG